VSRVRVCFLGTPEIAVTCLRRVLEDEHYEVVGVVTQPDRPSGRKMVLTPTPVKSLALAQGIPVISPESVNKDPILQEVQKWKAEVAVVVAFGQIVSQKFLDSFPFGCVNVHASLLPQWRGAAPIQRAIEAGDTESGVTLQKMVKALDAGDMLGSRKIKIDEEMTAQQLHDQMAVLGGELLHVELMDYVRGHLVPVPQDETKVTYAKKIDKSESEIRWTESAKNIHNRVRAFNMGPGTWTSLQGKKIKIHTTRVVTASGSSSAPGTVVEVQSGSLQVAAGMGVLEILQLQPESRNRMNVVDFLKGHPLQKGDHFG
jgi:methionyl-tRNA formyltransferase